MVDMVSVDSSNIMALGYDQDASEVHVQFKAGGIVYVHKKVPPAKWAAFLAAESKGGHYHKHFRGNPDHPGEILKPKDN